MNEVVVKTKTEIALSEPEQKAIIKIEKIVPNSGIAESVIKATQVAHLTTVLGEEVIKEKIFSLSGKPYGFLTDKDRPDKDGRKTRFPAEANGKKFQLPYPPDVVFDCAVQALIDGLTLHGNRFNIIGGRVYFTRLGYIHLLLNYKGLKDLKFKAELSKEEQKNAILNARAECIYNGLPLKKHQEVSVKKNNFMGVDALCAKGERKILKVLYEELTGNITVDADALEVQAEITDGEPLPLPPNTRVKAGQQ